MSTPRLTAKWQSAFETLDVECDECGEERAFHGILLSDIASAVVEFERDHDCDD